MLNQLFEQPHALARHRAAPLLEERIAFLTQLADRGLSPVVLRASAQKLLVFIASFGLVTQPDRLISRDEIKSKLADHRLRSLAARWLRFLKRLEAPSVPASPFADKIKDFANYMERERGLSPVTIRNRCWLVPRFLDRLSAVGGSLREITPNQLDETFRGMVGQAGYARVTIQNWAGELRAFFRYAETRGWCRKGLAACIRGPRVFAQASLPTGPSWDEVRRLLAMTEGDRPVEIRDHAILMLLAVYGLRAGEVNRLRLDDFDWERELLTVTSSKTRRLRNYPLTRPVGDAVLRYLKEARPRTPHRELFLTLLAPVRPLRDALWGVVAKRLRPLNASLPHHGPHALRHACAARLLSEGLSLKEIGDHLGHLDPEATRIYAKVDLVGLRQVADFELGRSPMTLLSLIEQYIAFQQSLDTAFQTDASILRAFARTLGAQVRITDVRPQQVEAFLGETRPVTITWHTKFRRLRSFFHYAVSRGYLAAAPLPTAIPKRPPPFVPYIFSQTDLRRLFQVIDADERKSCLEPATMHTLILLLYGAGLRLREAVDLNRADVDLNGSILTIRKTKFGKTRLVPFGPQLGQALTRYAARTQAPGAEPTLFTTRIGTRVKPDTLQHNFRILCNRAGVHRTDGALEKPRLHDLRHSFAVHRLTSWYQQGADVQRLLQHLSVYLGHVHIRHTQVYLTMTPELLHEASQRFEVYAAEREGPHD